jgi:hypothetical protein
MGYMRHHAIVVTGPNSSYLADGLTMQKVRDHAAELCPKLVSELIPSRCNGYESFFVAPDGSKEGWEDSEDGDNQRANIVGYLESLRYEDGSTSFKYAEIQFGDDNNQVKVIAASEFEQKVAR